MCKEGCQLVVVIGDRREAKQASNIELPLDTACESLDGCLAEELLKHVETVVIFYVMSSWCRLTANRPIMSACSSFHSLDGLSLADRVLFSKFSKGPSQSIPHNVVHHAFEAVALAHPQVTAIRNYDGTTITYRELNRRANMLANELRVTFGLRVGDRVVLVYSRCIEMVVFILAVLKAGGQYVPLDGGIVTDDTLGFDIVDSNAPVVICLPKFREKVLRSIPPRRQGMVSVIDLDQNSRLWRHGNSSHPMVNVGSDHGAYVIYTSGTTGRPKGVDVRHGGVTNTLLAEPSRLGIRVGSNVAQQLNVAFDMCESASAHKKTSLTKTRRMGDSRHNDERRHAPHPRQRPRAMDRLPTRSRHSHRNPLGRTQVHVPSRRFSQRQDDRGRRRALPIGPG